MKRREFGKQYAIFTILTIGFILWAFGSSNDLGGLLINILAVLIMAGVIRWGIGAKMNRKNGIHHLILATYSLENATNRIRDLAANPDNILEDILGDPNSQDLFDYDALNQAYIAHRAELDRLYREESDFRYVDIAEYINQDVLNHIANTQFNDLVPGTMTGVGILGTFVGLMIGLRDFDPSTAETMMLTIPPLIDGIKIAFLTSIFGVIYSLVFNTKYRIASENASNALEEFLAVYYKYVLPRPENDGFTKLIQYQKNQSENMAQLAEELSLNMVRALSENVVPTFERIEKNFERLSDKLANTQDQNMERITSQFIGMLDKLMGNQMVKLGENIENLNAIQTEAAENMKKSMDEFAAAGGSLGSVSTNLQETVATMASYMKQVESMQGKLQDEYTAIVERFANVSEELEKQQEALQGILSLEQDSMKTMQQMHEAQTQRIVEEKQASEEYRAEVKQFCENVQSGIQKSASSMLDTMNSAVESQIEQLHKSADDIETAQKQIIHEFQECCESVCKKVDEVSSGTVGAVDEILQQRVAQINEVMQKIDAAQKLFVTEMSDASEKLGKASSQISNASTDLTSNLDKAMSRTYQEIDRQLAEIVRHLSGTITDIREITEKVPHMLSISAEQMQASTTTYLEQLNSTQNELLKTMQQFIQPVEE